MTKLFGLKIKHQRNLHNMSLQNVADDAGKSKAYIYQIEINKSDPVLSVILALSEIFNCTAEYLINDDYHIGTYPNNKIICNASHKLNKIKELLND